MIRYFHNRQPDELRDLFEVDVIIAILMPVGVQFAFHRAGDGEWRMPHGPTRMRNMDGQDIQPQTWLGPPNEVRIPWPEIEEPPQGIHQRVVAYANGEMEENEELYRPPLRYRERGGFVRRDLEELLTWNTMAANAADDRMEMEVPEPDFDPIEAEEAEMRREAHEEARWGRDLRVDDIRQHAAFIQGDQD